jgi:predicted cupin superfamily sugar epimerase
MSSARHIIDRLELQPHREGGWFRETWRAESSAGERGQATAIHFLLEAGQRSHWHKVDAAEIWLWHAGDPLLLSEAADEQGPVSEVVLGGDVLADEVPQYVIPAHNWQAAAPLSGPHGYTLVSCVVAPAFEFNGFVLAAPDWQPGG